MSEAGSFPDKLTLAEKLWLGHLVRRGERLGSTREPDLIFIDMHLLHEVTSPQAFSGLRLNGRKVRHPELTLAVEDHNVPTINIEEPPRDNVSRAQLEALRANCEEFGVRLFQLGDINQGIVHVIGPQIGLTQPGMTIVCGDSHTATHGAFGSLAFGIGTSEVEHVLATQTLSIPPFRKMAINITSKDGSLPPYVTAKDVILKLVATIGAAGAQGYAIEYRGNVIDNLSMEGRMTICNMSIEAGARAGMIAPDRITFDYLEGRPHAPKGADWDAAIAAWIKLRTDEGATFDREVDIDVDALTPFVTWGTSPDQGLPLSGKVPDPDAVSDPIERRAIERALLYMGLAPGTPLNSIRIDTVFLGSCTNARIEDLRAAAAVLKGHRIADGVRMLVVPGSMLVREQAEREGLSKIFTDAGAQWRASGCSMCVAMGDDILAPQERCVSTSNRSFEGRQGKGGRTHLASPAVAAASAIKGKLSAPSELNWN